MSEFARPVKLDTLGGAPRAIAIEADADERAALAARFGLLALDRLTATATLTREGDVVTAEGRIDAAVRQSCVATGEPLPATIDAPFALHFVPEAELAGEGEIELGEADLDTIGYADGAVDLGEAVAETLGLSLDPFPRSPDAETALRAAGVLAPEEAGPFAALKALKGKLG